MGILQLTVTIAMIVALVGCSQKNNLQHTPAPQQTGTDSQEIPGTQTGPIIGTIQIILTLDCVPIKLGPPPADSLAGVATTLTLHTSDQRNIRFETGAHDKPPLAFQPNGDYALTLSFRPENTGDVYGQPVSNLSTVKCGDCTSRGTVPL